MRGGQICIDCRSWRDLHRLGLTERRAAKELRTGRNTAKEYRRALSDAGVLEGSADELPTLEVLKAIVLRALPPRPAPQRVSKLEEWQPAVEALFEQRLGPQAIHDRLRLEYRDYQGSIGGLKRMVRRIHRSRGVRPEDVPIPVDTEPGDVAQVDFGCGAPREFLRQQQLPSGKKHPDPRARSRAAPDQQSSAEVGGRASLRARFVEALRLGGWQ